MSHGRGPSEQPAWSPRHGGPREPGVPDDLRHHTDSIATSYDVVYSETVCQPDPSPLGESVGGFTECGDDIDTLLPGDLGIVDSAPGSQPVALPGGDAVPAAPPVATAAPKVYPKRQFRKPDPNRVIDPSVPVRRIELRRRDWKITYWGDDNPRDKIHAHGPDLQYAVWQRELCPKTKRLHWQCFIQFHCPKGPAYIKELVFKDMRTWTSILGPDDSRQKQKAYCMKKYTRSQLPDSGPFEFGVLNDTTGKRTDLQVVRKRIEAGATMSELVKDDEVADTVMRTQGGVKAALRAKLQDRAMDNRKLTVSLFYGESGTGKTWDAYKQAESVVNGDRRGVFVLDPPNVPDGPYWFDSYEGQQCLIIDEVHTIPWTLFLKWLDVYPVRLPVKGDHSYACWTHVWITSNVPIEEWHMSGGKNPLPIPEHLTAMKRRIHNIVHYSKVMVVNEETGEEEYHVVKTKIK